MSTIKLVRYEDLPTEVQEERAFAATNATQWPSCVGCLHEHNDEGCGGERRPCSGGVWREDQ
jgi:hypothetical protein